MVWMDDRYFSSNTQSHIPNIIIKGDELVMDVVNGNNFRFLNHMYVEVYTTISFAKTLILSKWSSSENGKMLNSGWEIEFHYFIFYKLFITAMVLMLQLNVLKALVSSKSDIAYKFITHKASIIWFCCHFFSSSFFRFPHYYEFINHF